MSALEQMQQQMQRYLLAAADSNVDVDVDVDVEATEATSLAATVHSHSGVVGLDAAARLAIYHRAYRSRLRQALCEAYDKTWTLLGDERFAALANGYLAEHPSQHANLRWFGAGLADYAALALVDYPCVAELARLEWALGLAFDAEDTASLSAADLATLTPSAWADLRLRLQPSVQRLTLHWNTVALWQALAADSAPPSPHSLSQPSYWLVWRYADQPHFRSLPQAEAEALQRIADGASFGAVCAAAGEGEGEGALLALAGYLQQWLAQGVLHKS